MGNNGSEDEWKIEKKKRKKEVIFVESFKLGSKS